jgi:hypothetical protein
MAEARVVPPGQSAEPQAWMAFRLQEEWAAVTVANGLGLPRSAEYQTLPCGP